MFLIQLGKAFTITKFAAMNPNEPSLLLLCSERDQPAFFPRKNVHLWVTCGIKYPFILGTSWYLASLTPLVPNNLFLKHQTTLHPLASPETSLQVQYCLSFFVFVKSSPMQQQLLSMLDHLIQNPTVLLAYRPPPVSLPWVLFWLLETN